MKEDFIQAGVGQFGSGWAWLAVKDGKIAIMKTPNGENPLVHGAQPILGCDVWEHSYYIDYRNRRPDYLKAFLDNLVNWEHVEEMYENYLANPGSVPDTWREYFDALQHVSAVDGSNAKDVPHLPVINAFAQRAKQGGTTAQHKAAGRKGGKSAAKKKS